VFADNDADGTVDTAAPADTVLRAWPALAEGYTLRSGALAANIRYNARGMAHAAGDFVLCQGGTLTTAKAVVVTLTRPRVATNGADSTPDTDAGANFTTCTP
jgi:type IV fimbrial biogenesis protein FimT